jgi:Zn-dependent membrane protease YugP
MIRGDEQRRRQRSKNIALGLILLALVVLFYLITIVKMGTT